MASNEFQTGFSFLQKQRATLPIWACLRTLSQQGSNREGAAIVASFQIQMDRQDFEEVQALAS